MPNVTDENQINKIHFENFTEVLVDEVIDDLFAVPTLGVCKCERCRYDIKALALNRLPPKYVVTQKGEIYAKLDIFRNQMRVDVLKSVIEAIEMVKKNPSH
ncbi:MAG TPA: late competence development ComFB family protein [Thermotogota bacterium]|nr:late competence development ComFB family protein [Thermotogota bacterium]HPJ88261.1 late competence development ComFB family protein [Thermotogota bacterium]HPR96737.1 late competence development ComFB family protein [Thermotogota bacterium]